MRCGLAMLLGCMLAGQAQACSVPVFRYALERWKPSGYPVYVYHRGPLTDAHRSLIARLEEPATPANLHVQLIDLADKPDADALKLWQKHGQGAAMPCVLVPYPDTEVDYPLAFRGPLDDTTLTRLLVSPARKQVIDDLARGTTAVWVLLESGDRVKDDDAISLLARELKRLESAIELPEQPEQGSLLLTKLPLKVSFAIVRVRRDSADEDAFVRMLLHSDEGLEKVKGPIAFPIFGRGRALCALEGKSLTAKDIEVSARFLCGACSCQVKELNPGTDMLLSADWDELLESPPLAPTTPTPVLPAPTIPPGKPRLIDDVPEEPWRGSWHLVGLVAAAIGVTAGVWAWTRRRHS